MGFPRQEYWSGLLCPPLGYFPDPETEPMSLTSFKLQHELDIYEDMHKIKELRASNRQLKEIFTSSVNGNTIWTEGKFLPNLVENPRVPPSLESEQR